MPTYNIAVYDDLAGGVNAKQVYGSGVATMQFTSEPTANIITVTDGDARLHDHVGPYTNLDGVANNNNVADQQVVSGTVNGIDRSGNPLQSVIRVSVLDSGGNFVGYIAVLSFDGHNDGDNGYVLTFDPVVGEVYSINIANGNWSSDGDISYSDLAIPGVACFTNGTLIRTLDGDQPVETLQVGDLLWTKHNSYQPILWIGKWSCRAALTDPVKQPVRIQAGAIDGHAPKRTVVVSPQHRILMSGENVRRNFDADEVLVPAKKLRQLKGVSQIQPRTEVNYVHFLLPQHSIVMAEGMLTESLYLGKDAHMFIGEDRLGKLRKMLGEESFSSTSQTPAAPIIERMREIKMLFATVAHQL